MSVDSVGYDWSNIFHCSYPMFLNGCVTSPYFSSLFLFSQMQCNLLLCSWSCKMCWWEQGWRTEVIFYWGRFLAAARWRLGGVDTVVVLDLSLVHLNCCWTWKEACCRSKYSLYVIVGSRFVRVQAPQQHLGLSLVIVRLWLSFHFRGRAFFFPSIICKTYTIVIVYAVLPLEYRVKGCNCSTRGGIES